MKLFVLALVSRGGLHSLYELQSEAGLEPGSIHRLLGQMETDGLLQRTEERRRRLMTVTSAGEQLLEEEWHDCLQDYSDAESVLRAATIAVLLGHQQTAHDFLMGVADEHERKAGSAPGRSPRSKSPLELYQHMRWSLESQRRRAAAKVFREIARELLDTERH